MKSFKSSVCTKKFVKNGFCIVKNVFEKDEIMTLQECVNQSINRIAKNLLVPYETSYPEEPFNHRLVLAARKDPTYTNAIIASLYTDGHLSAPINNIYAHNQLQKILKKLIVPMPNQTPTVRIRISLASHPEKDHPWHSDIVNPESKDCGSIKLACWIPLTDITKENGSLEIVAKKFNKPFVHQNNGGHFFIPEKVLKEYTTAVVECDAGDIVFIDSFTPHKTLKNFSSIMRCSILIWVKGLED